MLKSIENLALRRAGADSVEELLAREGLDGGLTEAVLMPYLVGYELRRIRAGDTYAGIAAQYGTTVQAIQTANPEKDPLRLQVGQILVIPLNFPVVPENMPVSSELLHYIIRGLQARYPMLRQKQIGSSVSGRPITLLRVGEGSRVALYNAAHHANEYITVPVVLRCLEQYLRALSFGEKLMGLDIVRLGRETTLFLVPMVNPDGVDLVLGDDSPREAESARVIGEAYPEIPFPEGWKANIRGVDLNLNYPARWDEAREIKYELGFDTPAPRDYVGPAPLSEPESRAMFDITEEISPDVTIAWHTQGKEIYWKFLDLAPEGAEALGRQMAAASGYALEEIAYASSFAGYKDWFIQDFDRPGYTVEAGAGTNPLPIDQLPEMIRDNLPIFLLGLTGALPERREDDSPPEMQATAAWG